jgi:[calcium/calmodulin-dependent protein kinase] kinase
MATAERTPRTRSPTPSEVEAAGILPSHGIHINFPPTTDNGRPQMIKHMSVPTYQSPIRHHRRAPSRSGAVKETLDARTHYGSSDDDGPAVHRINQYVIKQEIGRGSFGSVHLAVDQYGQEFVRLSMRAWKRVCVLLVDG